ncbi:MAG: hypothetical protein LBU41_01905 [Clostridiales Family XIII bacterium]|jgi:type II secretory pathway pseudopilin PulG|nr:hypothetical protein [Clostridiales Family XIII bacterium]
MLHKRVFKSKRTGGALKLLCFIVIIVVAIILVWFAVGTLQESNDEQQLKIAESAIARATIQCYALEGRYPPSLDYLTKNYGVTLNTKHFVYYYQSIGENLMPDIQVFPLEGALRG